MNYEVVHNDIPRFYHCEIVAECYSQSEMENNSFP